MEIGEYSKRYRAENKMSQTQLAEKLACNSSSISMIENGWSERVTFEKFCKMVALFNLSAEEVIDCCHSYLNNKVSANAESNR